ncbi:ABC transporter permease [Embleya sp. NBC_00888]|uniref:ABC transporter permease n=1 Tax=Embleya sp. NBC_00888 TaxID=2975960 RepID=UPI0038676ADB|nr:ABC transporter permease [Embleya sp. NBC_00888]
MRALLRDTAALYRFGMHEAMNNRAWIVLGLSQPVMWLVLFGPLLGSLRGPGLATDDDQLSLFVPGLLMMVALFGSMFMGLGLLANLRCGMLERLAATPVSRFALLTGAILRDATLLLGQALVLLAVGAAMGLRSDPLGTVLTLVLVLLVGVLGAATSYGLALVLREESTLAGAVNVLTMPLTLVSGLLLPISLAPGWLSGLARADPLYYAVEGARHAMTGNLGATAVPVGFAVTGALIVLVALWVTPKFRKVIV